MISKLKNKIKILISTKILVNSNFFIIKLMITLIFGIPTIHLSLMHVDTHNSHIFTMRPFPEILATNLQVFKVIYTIYSKTF